jgi:hypothetical protein
VGGLEGVSGLENCWKGGVEVREREDDDEM